MSRSGYDESDDIWAIIRWRGAVKQAFKGKRGQAFLKEMQAALLAMLEKEPRLITNDLARTDGVCAIGAVGRARGIEMSGLVSEDEDDDELAEDIAATFDVAGALAREIMWENDDGGPHNETPEHRFMRMLKWVEAKIIKDIDEIEARS